jgi:hypothetical protein
MKIISLMVVCFAVSGCSNQYLERKDTVTLSAGNAVAWNSAQQIPDPAPPRSNDTRIVADGDKAARAVQRNIEGSEKWFHDQSDELTDNILPAPPSGSGGAGQSGGGGGAGASAGPGGQ